MKNNTFIALLLLITFAGCKSNKQIAMIMTPEVKETAEFFNSIDKQTFNFHTLSAKTNMDFKLPEQERSLRVDIKMTKDSVIQLSFQVMLGIEAARMEFTVDTVKMVDRINKQYLIESYSTLKGQTQFDFNFYNLQALITNRIFAPGVRSINPSVYGNFMVKNEGGMSKIQIQDAAKMLYTFIADKEEKLLSTDINDSKTEYNLKWKYSDFKKSEGLTFPMNMNLQVTGKGETAFALKISFSRLQRNVSLNQEFAIPKNYKRVTMAELMKVFGAK